MVARQETSPCRLFRPIRSLIQLKVEVLGSLQSPYYYNIDDVHVSTEAQAATTFHYKPVTSLAGNNKTSLQLWRHTRSMLFSISVWDCYMQGYIAGGVANVFVELSGVNTPLPHALY